MRIDRVKFVSELTRQDMSLIRLGKMSGLSRATLSSVKCGKTCAYETAGKIAKALNIPVEELLAKEA